MKPLLCLTSLNSPKYFSFRELIKTNQPLDNYPYSFTIVNNLHRLAMVLDCIREDAAMAICVNSAYRSAAVNAAVGGSATSYHLQGRAADIRPLLPNRPDLFEKLVNVVKSYEPILSEIIIHDNYIHLAI